MKSKLTLIPCTEPYWEFVRELRMNPRVADGFTQRARITPKQQRSYMAKHWREHFICLLDGKPAGYIGSIDKDIRVCTHPDFQRKGVGIFMLKELVKIFPDSFAKIKLGNKSSKRLFEKCGFVPMYTIYEQRPKL
jgi:GNAT superfamily N-acetyltransferase